MEKSYKYKISGIDIMSCDYMEYMFLYKHTTMKDDIIEDSGLIYEGWDVLLCDLCSEVVWGFLIWGLHHIMSCYIKQVSWRMRGGASHLLLPLPYS